MAMTTSAIATRRMTFLTRELYHSRMAHSHFDSAPSEWVRRWSTSIRPGGAVLDLATGAGRHARLLARMGFEVDAVDRDASLFADPPAQVRLMQADVEGGAWPYQGRLFDGIVVTNYLHRPLLPILVASLEPGGMLVYETFAHGNEKFGKPSNPAFLLAPGELLEAVRGKLRVLAFEDLVISDPRPAAVQRLAARRE
jgi:SAM-dependent methyltransferase